MPKKRLTELAEHYDVPFEEAMQIVTEKLPKSEVTGRGKITWIGESGQEILENSMMIDEITPKHYQGNVIAECPNQRYNYVYSKEIGKKVPVLIPARYKGKMIGKMMTFEAIEDERGVTYRYIKS
jgi:hypothetical protein